MRRICYVSGTRADFGLMQSTLAAIDSDPDLDLTICVTGMHLSQAYGHTVDEIERAGFRLAARIPVDVETTSGASMARAIALQLGSMAAVFEASRPDIVLLLGDRGEMIAAALAAIHLNIVVCHIHGGERSGTVDEPIRHAISKLAHVHLAATEESRERLTRMGEDPARIFVTGAPGLDGLAAMARLDRESLCSRAGFDSRRPVCLLVYHPVVQEETTIGDQVHAILRAVTGRGLQAVCLMPNSDAGGSRIRSVLAEYADSEDLRFVAHVAREEFISWMRAADLMLGNSSSGIIEAATFGTPVINVGTRQQGRQRNANVVDVRPDAEDIGSAIDLALRRGRTVSSNVYGDGDAGGKIVKLLRTIELAPSLLAKTNCY